MSVRSGKLSEPRAGAIAAAAGTLEHGRAVTIAGIHFRSAGVGARWDAQALERLYSRYLPRLRRWTHGRLPPSARRLVETDDLVQDVLLRTVRRVDGFEARAGAGFHSYLRQACLNRIRDEIRRLGRTPAMDELAGDEHDPGPTPWDAVLTRDQRDQYEAACSS